MSTTEPATPPFTITDQTHEEVPLSNGTMEGEWRIDFTTPSGIQSFIRVPDAMYEAGYIHAQIADKVAEIEKVQAGPHA